MHISLSLNTTLAQTLTPQQVQYLKLLQLTNLQLEQFIQQELETNPMLEELQDPEIALEDEEDIKIERMEEDILYSVAEGLEDIAEQKERKDEQESTTIADYDAEDGTNTEDHTWQDYIEDDDMYSPRSSSDDHDDPFPIKAVSTFVEDLIDQLRLLPLSPEEKLLGEEILWNLEPSGYLERDMSEIVAEANERISEQNSRYNQRIHNPVLQEPSSPYILIHDHQREALPEKTEALLEETETLPEEHGEDLVDNPIERQNGTNIYSAQNGSQKKTSLHEDENPPTLSLVTLEQAEYVLSKIQSLDPPGIGARSLRECLMAQLSILPRLNAAQKLAVKVLTQAYDAFRMKHYDVIMRELKVNEGYLREALDAIRALNPKPGGGELTLSTQTIIPDFFVEYDEEEHDFFVRLNDNRVPAIRINKEYEKVRKEARRSKFNKETKEWLRKKFDDAKFLIQAMRQRRDTMRKVITAIVHHQREFFRHGENYLKPLIYRDIAEDTGLDISTVCRVVNGKYAQTEYGIFELRYFFSESLESDEGEEISTKVIRNKLKELIDDESKGKPLSDQKLVKELKKIGLNVARRTVAKYREQMKIPVARLRKEL